MSTQPLLQESTSDAHEIARASLQLEDFQGLVDPFLNPGQDSLTFLNYLKTHQLPRNVWNIRLYMKYLYSII